MSTYNIAVVCDGKAFQSKSVPAPDVLPLPGQRLIVQQSFITKALKPYQKGDVLQLLHRTENAPHFLLSSLGNWIIRCPHFLSIWSNVEWMMAEGVLVVDPASVTVDNSNPPLTLNEILKHVN